MNLCAYWNTSFQGSTTMIIAPLTTIKLQLEGDCHKLGFSALVGDQVFSTLDLEMCTVQPLCITFIAPHYYECQLLFLSYSQKTSRGSC